MSPRAFDLLMRDGSVSLDGVADPPPKWPFSELPVVVADDVSKWEVST